MGSAWNAVWLTAAFVSELAALAALCYWGFAQDRPLPLRLVLGLGAPVLAGVLWGVFAAPQAPIQVLALTLLVKVVVFGSAVWALVVTGHPRLAAALGVLALLGAVLSSPPASGQISGPAA